VQLDDVIEAWRLGQTNDFAVMIVTFVVTITFGVVQGIGFGASWSWPSLPSFLFCLPPVCSGV
jgi:MFS superfamily sulfate permease-like transporter